MKLTLSIVFGLFALTLSRSVSESFESGEETVTVPYPFTETVTCEGTGLQENPDDETGETFYMCGAQFAVMYTCPNGTLFNKVAKMCDHAENVRQGINDMCADTDGNPLPYGNYEDEADCRKFYNCFMGIGYHRDCGAGTVFDPDTESCSIYDEGQC